jgi:hypothetical protein
VCNKTDSSEVLRSEIISSALRNIRNDWVPGLCPLSVIINNYNLNHCRSPSHQLKTETDPVFEALRFIAVYNSR